MLNRQGFSLVELMAILVILALCSSIALPSFGNSMRKNQFKKDSRTLMATLRGFKLKAISSGKPLHVSYEDGQLNITVQGDEPILSDLHLHADTTLTFTPETLYFSPQGWARPAEITLERANLRQTIILDPLSGRPYKKQRGDNK